MCFGFFFREEKTGGFHYVFHSDLIPFQIGRVLLSCNSNGFPVYYQLTIFDFDCPIETTVYTVVLEHVRHIFHIDQVVDGYNFNVASVLCLCCAEYQAADTAKAVNTYFRHN